MAKSCQGPSFTKKTKGSVITSEQIVINKADLTANL